MKKLFLDCESAGLRGEIFAAALIAENGTILFDGFFRHPDLETNTWLRENVAPNLTGQEYGTIGAFHTGFAEAYEGARTEFGNGEYNSLAIVAHMGSPVEANFFQQLFKAGYITEFAGPYPLLDTAPLLERAGHDPCSEEKYAESVGLDMPVGYRPHSALSDAELTRRVWGSLQKKQNWNTTG